MKDKEHHTEWAYIEAVTRNEEHGLRRIYALFLPRIRDFIRRNGGNESDAQDIFQDAIMILYEKARRPDFQLTSSFYSLLYGICYRLWSNRLKKSYRKEVTLIEDTTYKQESDIEELIEAEERHKLLFRALEKMGTDCRKLLEMFFQGASMKEIQAEMGYSSEAYTKKRKFHCKEKLAGLVKADPIYAELSHKKS